MTFRPAFDIAEGTVNGPPFHTQVVRIEITFAFCFCLDPAFAGGERHVERAVEDDVGDGVEAVRRQVLRAADEVAGGVVDEAVERAFVEDAGHHVFDGVGRRGCRIRAR